MKDPSSPLLCTFSACISCMKWALLGVTDVAGGGAMVVAGTEAVAADITLQQSHTSGSWELH
jgi:hypothetical protein